MTQPTKPDPIRFDSPIRERIHRRLGLVGEGPQAFYRDALRLVTGAYVESTTHLVSHLVREIESALRDVLEPIAHYEGRVKAKGTQTHEQEVRVILSELGLSETEGPGAAWLEIVQTGLHELAHRRSLERPRPLDEQFYALWAEVELVLDAVLGRFESRFLELHDEADRLLAKPVPSKADLKYLKDYLPNNSVTRCYFFDNLQHSAWLEPLAEAGFFSDPPAAIHDAQAETTSHPYWPVARYLKRMATVAASQEAVAKIVREVPDVDNTLVHDALTDVLLDLPADRAAGLIDRVAGWVKDDTFTRLPQKAGDLAVRLLEANHTGEAFALMHSILNPGRLSSTEGMRSRSADTYWYSEVLTKSIPEFSRRNPHETLRLLGDCLEQTLRDAESDPGGELYSSVRRRAVERSQRWRQYEVVDLLVDAVRDAALGIVRTDPAQAAATVSALERRDLAIFRRIALFVLGSVPAASPELNEERLRQRNTFDHWHREPEYIRLLQAAFDRLSPAGKDEVLGWIEQGPSREPYEPKTEEEFASIKRSWQRSRLKTLQGQLDDRWLQRLGPVEESEPATDSLDDEGGWVGPSSPRSSDELTNLAPEDLVEFLRTWRPKSGWHESSPEGLGRVLTEAVTKEPILIAQQARLFRGLEPTYIRSLLRGLEEALKGEKKFEWSGVLDLCEWVVAQPREEERGRDDWNRDPGLSWSRKAAASLIAKGMDSESNRLPTHAREQVWRILEPVTWDPDPSAERDADRDDEDAFQVAINSVRGEGMIAVVRYAVWVDRHAREATGNAPGMAGMPEVERNLSEHLDFDREPSPAVRSVLGKAFPVLHWLDSRWATDHVERIFAYPADSGAARGAWTTYLRFCRPFDDLLPLLETLYRSAVESLDPGARLKADIDSVEYHLTTHLMSFMWRGVDGAEFLARELLLRGGGSVRHAAFDFIGRSLMNTEEDVPPEPLARLRSLWEWWRQEGGTRRLLGKEIEAFGWWFASGRFEQGWAEAQANWVLSNGSVLEPDHVVIERLEKMVNRNPLAAVRILDGIWENLRDQWTFHGWRDECRNILQEVLASESDEAKQVARALINKIAARGHLDFRSLLP